MAKNIKKRKNGTYSCIVYLKDPLTGKTRPKWKSGFHSEKEAEKARVQWVQEINENRYSLDSEVKLSIYLDSWLNTKKKQLTPGTYQGYNVNIENHIKPYIGTRRLNEITPIMLETLCGRLSKIRINRPTASRSACSAQASAMSTQRFVPCSTTPCSHIIPAAPRGKYEAGTL